jgi:hypothetical protein
MMPRALALAAVAIAGTSCGLLGNDDPDITVTVVTGTDLASPALRAAQEPAADHLSNSQVLVFVSAPLCSGSCPPEAAAEQDDAGVVTLSIDDSSGDVCTADANRDTFLVQGLPVEPTRLVVEQDHEDDVQIDLE